jgi:polyisoprenyl-phosphate glycosyltransferase
MKKISIAIPCYNEELNVEDVYHRIVDVFKKKSDYTYEIIFIDNSSKDTTVQKLKTLAKQDHNLKIIINSRNFGHIRSPYYAILQTTGDATIFMAADLQDPPELIFDFLTKWEEGYKVVVAVKNKSKENQLVFFLRTSYYRILNRLSDVDLVDNFTGFGLYDKCVVDVMRKIDDPYPYLRGIICEIGFERAEIEFIQPIRKRGATKLNPYILYDFMMLGMTNYTKVPLRIATILGFMISAISILFAFAYLLYKLIFWNSFSVGIAPLIIGLFFFSSVQLIFLGVLGEYVGMIYTHMQKRQLVIEKERVNFD